jgi:GNAT superfamily N-acetyltransferase
VLDALRRHRLRFSRGLETYGAMGLSRQAIGRLFHKDEEYVWYALDLARVEPLAFRGTGYELRLARAENLELLHEVPAIPIAEGRRRIVRGEQLWFVLKDGRPAFACSVFVHMLPLEAARKGRYYLPARVACVDDGLTNREFRGRAIAAAAWMAIAEKLRDDGFEVLIAKVPVDNIASRRTHEKTGFRPTVIMNRRRRGFRTRVTFRDEGSELTQSEQRSADHLRHAVAR